MSKDLLRSLPSIERMLTRPTAVRLSAELGRHRVRDLLREIIDELRLRFAPGATTSSDLSCPGESEDERNSIEEIERELETRAARELRPSLMPVINATGVIIHTNLGRAPLPEAALDALIETASRHSNLEYDLETGQRGHREAHCENLLARLTGAEAAVVANNNAAAVLLVLNTLAEGGEVIVSRGELIEIGGSFRIPEIMKKSGARLVEVGTTNRTRIQDYERAITNQTRLILRVHPSNFRMVGFVERPALDEIARLGDRSGIPSFEDLGSGCLVNVAPFGIADEPVVSASVRAGISIVSFSGDKMLGGPQGGIIAGKTELVKRVRSNPLMRALRVDKLTYAALEATLRIYQRGNAVQDVPVVRAMSASLDQIASRAELFCTRVMELGFDNLKADLEDGHSVIGGGSAPNAQLPTALVAIHHNHLTASTIEKLLRSHRPPIIARTERDRVVIDLRTVAPEEETFILDALAELARATQPASPAAAST